MSDRKLKKEDKEIAQDGDDARLAIFHRKSIRRQFYHGEWWFAINDVVAAVAETDDPNDYLKKLRRRDAELNEFYATGFNNGGGQIVPPLQLIFDTAGGPQKMKSWNTEGIFRLVQSIPSKNAEPFKRWLARVGYERVQEIENPELAQKRMKALYRLKGYPDEWIERRVRGIAIRDELTDEWKKRGVAEDRDYAILTAEISKATFGITPSEYKKLKGLKRENLRDHMDDLELLFTQLGEASTTAIARADDAHGFAKNKDAAKRGGNVAGVARRNLEEQTGERVANGRNYKSQGAGRDNVTLEDK
jgi:hypothetical protein